MYYLYVFPIEASMCDFIYCLLDTEPSKYGHHACELQYRLLFDSDCSAGYHTLGWF